MPHIPQNQSEEDLIPSKQKKLDSGAWDMVTAIMHRISDLHRKPGPGASGPHHEEDDRGWVRIITLVGNNTGAALHTEMGHEKSPDSGLHGPVEFGEGDRGAMGTYVNSNFQAINNSIMMGGSHQANDVHGVHMEISEFVEHKKGHGKHGKHKGEGADEG